MEGIWKQSMQCVLSLPLTVAFLQYRRNGNAAPPHQFGDCLRWREGEGGIQGRKNS